MSKLWVFGDSYGVPLSNSINWFWADQVKNELNCVEHVNRCVLGAANEFTQYCIMREESNISPEDYVIVISTSIDRKWFFRTAPYAGNFFCSNLEEMVGKPSAKAVEQYVLHLMNPDMIYVNFHQFLGWVHYVTDKNKWNLLVVPGFESDGFPISHNYEVKGSLFDVCENEFQSDSDNLWYYKDFCRGRDNRAGHLIKDNHSVLAKKITETFNKGKPLDLTNGFQTKIISKQNINLIQNQFIQLSS